MVFVGIEFCEADGGGIALIHEKWLTPRKREVWWPPVKQQDQFSKALKKGESPASNWKIFSVSRTFFEEGETDFILILFPYFCSSKSFI